MRLLPEAWAPGRRFAATMFTAAAYTAAACGAGEPPARGVVIRDSTGIAIVESATPVWATDDGWRVDSDPAVEIGVIDGDEAYQFHRVTDAARLSDGRLVVANGGSDELRYYAPDGAFLASIGGHGNGPEEYRSLSGLAKLAGDSLVTWDEVRSRMLRYDSSGRYLGARAIDRVPPGTTTSDVLSGLRLSAILDAFPDGTLLGRVFERLTISPGVHRTTGFLIRIARDGSWADSIAEFPGEAYYYYHSPSGGSLSVTSAPFSPRSVAAAHGDRVFVGHGHAFEIDVHTRDGRWLRRFRVAIAPRVVTDEIIARFADRRLASATDEDARRRIRRTLETATFPEHLPAYGDLLADAAGNLWIARYRAPGDDRQRWTVLDADGRWLGEVETPPGLRIAEIGEDYVLGVWRDALGVEYVRVHTLVKRGG